MEKQLIVVRMTAVAFEMRQSSQVEMANSKIRKGIITVEIRIDNVRTISLHF